MRELEALLSLAYDSLNWGRALNRFIWYFETFSVRMIWWSFFPAGSSTGHLQRYLQLVLSVALCFQVLLTSHPAKLVVAQSFHWAQVTPAGSFDICPVDCDSWRARHFLACRVHSGFPVLGAGWNLLARKKCMLPVLCLPAMFWLMVYSSQTDKLPAVDFELWPGISSTFPRSLWCFNLALRQFQPQTWLCQSGLSQASPPVLAMAFCSLFFSCSDRTGQSVNYSQGPSLRVKQLTLKKVEKSWDVAARDI